METIFEIELDDELLVRGIEVSGITDINELLRFAMEQFVKVEKAKRDRLNGNGLAGQSG